MKDRPTCNHCGADLKIFGVYTKNDIIYRHERERGFVAHDISFDNDTDDVYCNQCNEIIDINTSDSLEFETIIL